MFFPIWKRPDIFVLQYSSVFLSLCNSCISLTNEVAFVRECLDPFEKPECEAFDLFVNEVLCVGKGTAAPIFLYVNYFCWSTLTVFSAHGSIKRHTNGYHQMHEAVLGNCI